jgi:hypothetical protein
MKRGSAFPRVRSAVAITRRLRLQLLRIDQVSSLSRRAGGKFGPDRPPRDPLAAVTLRCLLFGTYSRLPAYVTLDALWRQISESFCSNTLPVLRGAPNPTIP